jgi:anti-sigma B factor antagonist
MNGPLGGMPPAEQLMTVARDDQRGCLVVVVRGEVDLGTGGRLMEATAEALQQAAGRPVVLDLSAVGFVSSSGLGQLVALHEEGQRTGTPVRVVVDRSGPAMRPIRTMGLDGVLSLFDTLDEALTA